MAKSPTERIRELVAERRAAEEREVALAAWLRGLVSGLIFAVLGLASGLIATLAKK